MAVLRVSLLLGSLILLFYWTTTSALSHDPTFSTTNSRPPTRIRRDLTYLTQEKTKEVMDTGKAALEAFKSTFDVLQETKTLSGIMEKISKFSGLVPGIGGIILSFVSMVLIFIPQESPTDQLQADLDEVNRKLDSLSNQISNLATDVEWHNYASVYSQDEVRILNAWKKLNETLESSLAAQTEEGKIRVAEMFTTFYENTGTEGSVASLYHYLTVQSTSLSKNLLQILKNKFKCDFDDVATYGFYFNSLMWRGMVLNQFYLSLIGFDPTLKAAEHTLMMKQVVKAQKEVLNYCKNNYEEYMKKDVEEIGKAHSYKDKEQFASEIKNALDKKYFWYNWVVVVYDTQQDYPDKTDGFTVIPMEKITVAVGFINKEKNDLEWRRAEFCYRAPYCSDLEQIKHMGDCYVKIVNTYEYSVEFTEVPKKLMHVSQDLNFALVPDPLFKHECRSGYTSKGSFSFYYSNEQDVCIENPCVNGGTCQRMLKSNDWMCDCPDDYYGKRCENGTAIQQPPKYLVPHPVPAISTINTKLNNMQSRIEEIYSLLQQRG